MGKERFSLPEGTVITGKTSTGKLVIDSMLGNYFATASKRISDNDIVRIASILSGHSETYFDDFEIAQVSSPEFVLKSPVVIELTINYKGIVEEIIADKKKESN